MELGEYRAARVAINMLVLADLFPSALLPAPCGGRVAGADAAALRRIRENWLAGGRRLLRNWSVRWRMAVSARSDSEGGTVSARCPL